MSRRSSLPAGFVLSIVLATSAAGSTGPTPPTFSLMWGSYGTERAQFQFPTGVATDALGDVYVADRSSYRIQKFDSRGNCLLAWGSYGTGNGQFNLPMGVAVDEAGNVYVADTGNLRIQKFTSTGAYLTQWGSYGSGNGQFAYPSGVAVDVAGNVHVADYFAHRIQKFTAAGVYLGQWGSLGAANGQFHGPFGIGADRAGNVYVADTENSRIQKFTMAGAYLAQWGTNGSGDGQLNRPAGVAADAFGNVFVADNDNHRIEEFTATGTFVARWGSAGSNAAQFVNPTGITVDAAANVYVADFNNNRIQKFSSAGAALAEGPGGSLLRWGYPGTGNGLFNLPFGVTVDYAGDVYVVDQGNCRVQKFSGTGNYLWQFGSSGTGNGQFGYPTGITTDASGYVYVVDGSNNNIQKFIAGGFLLKWGTTGSSPGQLLTPYDIAADPGGNLYVADRNNHRIQVFTGTGSLVTYWGSQGTGAGQFTYPSGVAVDAAGYVYVADTFNDRVQKFTANGIYVMQWSTGTEPPTKIAVDAHGHVFVTFSNASQMVEYTSNGTPLATWNGGLLYPWGVATDAAGNLFVADMNNDRIQKFAIPPAVALVSDVPNDQGRQVRIRFLRCSADAPGAGVTVTGYEIYRRNDPLPPPSSGVRTSSSSPGELQLAGWTWVTTVPAHAESEYNVEVPTLVDAGAASPQFTAYMVRAATTVPSVFYDSGTENGYSLDNLAPPKPSPFTATWSANATHLHWGLSPAADFATFRLYRGASVDFVPGPGNLLTSTTDTDVDDAGGALRWYKVSAVDRNGNESSFAIAGPGQTTDVTDDAAPLSLTLEGPRPNPARNGRLLVSFTLPSNARASLELFDLAGRRIVSREVGTLGAGRHSEEFSPGRGLAAGVYLVRLVQGAERRLVRVALID